MERRLAAIFAADMVGYSRLMEADEVGTLNRQKRHRAELIDPRIAAHGGRIIKLTGDGMIAEFPSVVEAVQCAVSVQREMDAREADVPEDRKIRYRVAVNLGDVIFDEGDVYGDGVNIAARLEGLAEPGGVVVSGTAYDHLKANVEVGYQDLGEQQVKNIATPVRVYRVVPEGVVVPVRTAAPKNRRSLVIGAIAVVLVAAALGIWRFAVTPGPTATAEDDPVLALPQGPKIVVLPFANLSNNADQDYFVDGLTEDLTTRLTDHGYLFVIGRTTALKYKGKSPDVREIGKDLGVDYVVEGSIQRSGDRVRINVQLLNARDGTHVWANTYDREVTVDNLFDVQDELTVGISQAIGGSKGAVTGAALRKIGGKRPEELASFECVLLSRSFFDTFDPATHAAARDCLEDAVEREPGYTAAWIELSPIYRWEYEGNINRRPDPYLRAEKAIDRALKLDPTSGTAHITRAFLMLNIRRTGESIASSEEALALSPNHPWVLHVAALTLMHGGSPDRAMALWRKANKLDPSGPSWTYWTPLHFHRQRGEYEKAYHCALILKQSTGAWHWVPATEAYLLAYMNRMDEAREALERALEINPDLAKTARDEISVWWWSQPDQVDFMMNGLYKAGLERPAEATQ